MKGPFALCDRGLRLVERATANLEPVRRAVFLQLLADRLGEGTPAIPALEIAIAAALDRLPPPVFGAPAQKEARP